MKKNVAKFIIACMCVFAVTLSPDDSASGAVKILKNSGEINFQVTVDAPTDSKNVRVWLPYPVTADDQTIENMRIDGTFTTHGVYRVAKTGSMTLYLEWSKPMKERRASLTFNVSAIERISNKNVGKESDIPIEIKPYTEGTRFLPVDGEVKKIALEVTKGKNTIGEKARAVYDWVVENTFRDPSVQGCGIGKVEETLAKRSGKCADISSVFVSIARAAGVPAREVFGLRLGKKDGWQDITKGHHCWAEFYQPGHGWIPADPADVRKVMLAENLSLDQARDYREYYFGAVGPNRIVLGKGGRNYFLSPPQNDGPLNYFMYPYAEVDGKKLEWLAAQKRLKYNITYNKSLP